MANAVFIDALARSWAAAVGRPVDAFYRDVLTEARRGLLPRPVVRTVNQPLPVKTGAAPAELPDGIYDEAVTPGHRAAQVPIEDMR